MRGPYTVMGRDLFGCLRSAAYGLRRPTVDEIWREGKLFCRPEHKLLPTGQGRDERLQAMVESLVGLSSYCGGGWQVKSAIAQGGQAT